MAPLVLYQIVYANYLLPYYPYNRRYRPKNILN